MVISMLRRFFILALVITINIFLLFPITTVAEVKSDTVEIDYYSTHSFSLQLNAYDTISWEWSTSGDSYDDLTIDFWILDGVTNEYLVKVTGTDSDKGSASIFTSGIYTIQWDDIDSYITLTYTITYTPYHAADPKDTTIAQKDEEIHILTNENQNLKDKNTQLTQDLEEERDNTVQFAVGIAVGAILGAGVIVLFMTGKKKLAKKERLKDMGKRTRKRRG